MADEATHSTVHEVTVDAPAELVYALIADVTRWPYVFPPTVYAEEAERDGQRQRIRIWATANDEVKTWTSGRILDPAALRVQFRQEVSQHPVAAMGGTWSLSRHGPDRTAVRLDHDFRAVGDDPAHISWIRQAIDRNSTAELGALKATAEAGEGDGGLLLSFADTVEVAGRSADLYDFINDAALWHERLPHVAEVRLREDTPGLQSLAMVTRAPDGSQHTTESVRICRPNRAIHYKQQVLPALLTVHVGSWRFEDHADGSSVTSAHTVVLNTARIAEVLGTGASVADARAFVHRALSGNSSTTMRHAKEYAEGRATLEAIR
jgi:aromatase